MAAMGEFIREIFYYEDYYLEFYEGLKPAVKKKFNWTLELIATIEKVPEKYFKYITDSTGLFEVRVEVGSDIFRVFSFFRQRKSNNTCERLSKENPKDPQERN
jgi:hypothetical protein